MARATRRGASGTTAASRFWLEAVASGAAVDSGAPADLLGEYLPLLADAAESGRRPHRRELVAVGTLGRRAAEADVAAGRAVDLYLSAAWRLWRELPSVARSRDSEEVRRAAEAVLRVVDDAVAAFVDGYQAARRQAIRREESLRRELIDDLLRGDADIAGVVARAEPFGLDLGGSHRVAVAGPAGPAGRAVAQTVTEEAASQLERAVLDRFGDRDVLVATKDGRLVAVVPGPVGPARTGSARAAADLDAEGGLDALLLATLDRGAATRDWRVAVGRPYAGVYGIARSYEEAREALLLTDRLRLDARAVHAGDLLVYRVLGRDHAAMSELVSAVLSPLTGARGGAEPLLATLEAYAATGAVATETARRLHLSVRTVTYRLARINALTGHDPADPMQRFTLQAAVLGARLLDWPTRPLPGT